MRSPAPTLFEALADVQPSSGRSAPRGWASTDPSPVSEGERTFVAAPSPASFSSAPALDLAAVLEPDDEGIPAPRSTGARPWPWILSTAVLAILLVGLLAREFGFVPR